MKSSPANHGVEAAALEALQHGSRAAGPGRCTAGYIDRGSGVGPSATTSSLYATVWNRTSVSGSSGVSTGVYRRAIWKPGSA